MNNILSAYMKKKNKEINLGMQACLFFLLFFPLKWKCYDLNPILSGLIWFDLDLSKISSSQYSFKENVRSMLF